MADLRLRGESGVVLLPAAALAAVLGGLAYAAGGVGDRTALALMLLQFVVVVAGLVAAAVVGSRRLTLSGSRLSFRSLTRRLDWQADAITAIRYEGHPSQGWHAHITIHHEDGSAVRLNVYLWHQSQVARVVQTLVAVNPRIDLSPATQGYLAVAR